MLQGINGHMRTPAIIASLTVAGSLAYAAGSQGVAGKQPPEMPSGSQAHSMQESVPLIGEIQTGCEEGEALDWFTTVESAPKTSTSCGFTASIRNTLLDIGGNGVFETLGWGASSDLFLVIGGVIQPPAPVLSRLQFQFANPSTPVIKQSVLRSDLITKWLESTGRLQDVANAHVSYVDWKVADLDGDKDLDLWGKVILERLNGTYSVDYIWVENTGNERTAVRAADINGDGRVDGADLGQLLADWGDSPR
jgi:hypothetical protein